MATPGDRPFFSEESSAEVVLARTGPNADPRVKDIMDSVVRHLHAVVKETEPTLEEWMKAIQFLTDALGVSMLVEAVNNRKPAGETEGTVLGPFFVPNAPHYDNGANIALDGKGEPLWVSGRVLDVDGKPIAGATLDVWQASPEGFYDVQEPDVQPRNNLRGRFTADGEGRFSFRSAYPRHCPIPHDGTVGKMLTALDRQPNRPAHVHFIIRAPGFRSLTTHLFTPDCPWLRDDAVFGVKESLIAGFRKSSDAARAEELKLPVPFWEVAWDFVLSRE
jgi:catechol 1,2-dioxygenase